MKQKRLLGLSQGHSVADAELEYLVLHHVVAQVFGGNAMEWPQKSLDGLMKLV